MTEQERFDRCLAVVLRLEGGYSDRPDDPGGPTKLGITLATLSGAWGRAATAGEVKALTPDQAAAIYRQRYWDASGCARWPAGLDLMVFDTAVNMGPGVAVRLLQAAAGARVDGEAGPRTVAAAMATPAESLIADMARLREARYRGLAGFAAYGHGWLNRVRTVLAQALTWAAPAQRQSA
jgi:lysozyme family protein